MKGAAMQDVQPSHVAMIQKYLQDRKRFDDIFKKQPFLTISRQAGAGGHTVGREVIRQLEDRFPKDPLTHGWEVFDQKLCVMILQNTSVNVSFESLIKEEYKSEAKQFVSDLLEGKATQYSTYKKTFHVIRLLCQIGKVVIVGRGGAHLTRDLPNGVHVRLVANTNERIERMTKMFDITTREATKQAKEQDKNRARLVHDFFNQDIDDPLQYDAMYNTSTLNVDQIAHSILELVISKLDHYRAQHSA
ncbi:MAG: cytidylate kinase-like family protein [Saprospiraceae bacterium]|nr:cytidylate kinase-like family protein [Saprospiraceae bacterium]